MHEEEALEKGMKLVPTWLPILGAILTAVFTSGVTFATVKADNVFQDRRMDRIEEQLKTDSSSRENRNEALEKQLREISDRLARIEGKLSK